MTCNLSTASFHDEVIEQIKFLIRGLYSNTGKVIFLNEIFPYVAKLAGQQPLSQPTTSTNDLIEIKKGLKDLKDFIRERDDPLAKS